MSCRLEKKNKLLILRLLRHRRVFTDWQYVHDLESIVGAPLLKYEHVLSFCRQLSNDSAMLWQLVVTQLERTALGLDNNVS